jgi:hypothetical protein
MPKSLPQQTLQNTMLAVPHSPLANANWAPAAAPSRVRLLIFHGRGGCSHSPQSLLLLPTMMRFLSPATIGNPIIPAAIGHRWQRGNCINQPPAINKIERYLCRLPSPVLLRKPAQSYAKTKPPGSLELAAYLF